MSKFIVLVSLPIMIMILTMVNLSVEAPPAVTALDLMDSPEDFLIKDSDIKEELRKRLHSKSRCRRVFRKEMSKYTKYLQSLSEEITRLEAEIEVMKKREEQTDRQINDVIANLTQQNNLVHDTADEVNDLKHRLDKSHPQVNTSTLALGPPADCDEVYRSGGMRYPGTYMIQIKPERSDQPFTALCQSLYDSGWVVIQQRFDGAENFKRSWKEYKNGFGSLHSEFWLGNEYIHLLTSSRNYSLRVEIEEHSGKKHWAEYSEFRIDDEQNKYTLHISGYEGNAGDAMTHSVIGQHDGAPFTTYDQDNDKLHQNCADTYSSGWWYNKYCWSSNLNGRYLPEHERSSILIIDGVVWGSLNQKSLKSTRMMIKPNILI